MKKLVGRRDMENALQRLENMTLEETRMTGAETLKAIHGVEGVLQGVTDMLQSVDDRVKVIGDKVISGAQTIQLATGCPVLSLSIWLGVEETEQQTENVISDRVDGVHGQRGGGQAGGDFGDLRPIQEILKISSTCVFFFDDLFSASLTLYKEVV
jgi:hypothetical protein